MQPGYRDSIFTLGKSSYAGMKNKKLNAWVMIAAGLLIIAMGLFVYFEAHTIFPDSGSSRVQDLNRLLRTFGRSGTSLLFGAIGLAIVCAGFWKHKKQQ